MVNSPQLTIKIIVFTHFVLTVWAAMSQNINFLPPAYIYMNGFILAFGVWAIICPESTDAVFSFMILNLISIILDIIFLGIFTPMGQAINVQVHLFRFSLAMAIINLLLKPFTSFIVFRIYQDRGGQYGDINIPGIPRFGSSERGPGYEDIDQPVPSNNVETASPHTYTPSPGGQ